MRFRVSTVVIAGALSLHGIAAAQRYNVRPLGYHDVEWMPDFVVAIYR